MQEHPVSLKIKPPKRESKLMAALNKKSVLLVAVSRQEANYFLTEMTPVITGAFGGSSALRLGLPWAATRLGGRWQTNESVTK